MVPREHFAPAAEGPHREPALAQVDQSDLGRKVEYVERCSQIVIRDIEFGKPLCMAKQSKREWESSPAAK
jgi:hypothetical protein